MALDLERCFMAESSTVKEAVVEAWRAYASMSTGEDASTWEATPFLEVTTQQDQELKNRQPLPDHTDEPLVVVDIDRLVSPMGFVIKV
jgi:hypothetical protein